MKNLIILVLLIISISVSGQNNFKYIINANGGIKASTPITVLDVVKVGSPTTDTLATQAYARLHGGGGSSYAWSDSALYYNYEYNIINYGAVSDDGNSDSEAIRATITAALAASEQNDPDGAPIPKTVFIPNGVWKITDSIILKSHLNLVIDNNAYFYVPDDFYGSIFYSGSRLFNCNVSGGYYHNAYGRTGNVIKLYSPSSAAYVMECRFKNMVTRGFYNGIDLVVRNNGYINWNIFENIHIWYPYRGIHMSESSGSLGLDGNGFHEVAVQMTAGEASIGIDTVSGNYNYFSNCHFWDLEGGDQTIIMTGNYNVFIGGSAGDPATYVVNTGWYNYVHYRGLNGIAYQNPMTLSGVSPASDEERLYIRGFGTNGTRATPAGDVGFRIKSMGTSTADTDLRSVRIMARNMGTDSNDAEMVLQTYNVTAAGFIDMMKLHGYYKTVTINDVLALTLKADPPSPAVEGMIYADTDHHLYYYNGTSWDQLDAD